MVELSQQEADLLIAIEKVLTNPKKLKLPQSGRKDVHELLSVDGREEYKFSAYRGSAKAPNKISYSILYQHSITLLKVDNSHGLHINPDDTTIPPFTPHIHLY